jgi:hypothetical protein
MLRGTYKAYNLSFYRCLVAAAGNIKDRLLFADLLYQPARAMR